MKSLLDPSRALAASYAAGLDGARWKDALATIVEASGASGAQLLIESAGKQQSLVSIGIDPAENVRYNQHYARLDPIPLRLSALAAGSLVSCRDLISREERRRSTFFAEWADPNEVDDAAFLILSDDADSRCTLALGHPNRAEPFLRPALRAYLERIAPHLVNAVRIARHLETARAKAQACKASFDRLSCGWALLSADCRLCDINDAARAMLDANDGLHLRQGVLELADRSANERLRKTVRAATGSGAQSTDFDRVLIVPRPSNAKPYVVRMVPHQGPDSMFGAGCAHLAIIIADPEREEANLIRTLMREFGLTPAEARVSIEVSRGRGLRHVSLERGVSLSTTRVHLQRVFEKTDTHRQAELIVLMEALRARS